MQKEPAETQGLITQPPAGNGETKPGTSQDLLNRATATKMEAEAGFFRAQMAAVEQATRVEETLAKATIAEQEAKTAMSLLNLERNSIEHRLWQANPLFRRVYNFNSAIRGEGANGPNTVGECIETLSVWSRYDATSPIKIVLNTPGGDVFSGMALFDFIRSLDHQGIPITIEAHGLVASMGTTLLQAATQRHIGREAFLMIHELSGAGGDQSISGLRDTVSLMERLQARIMDIYIERAGGKLSRTLFATNWSRREWWLSATEALGLGIVDAII